jgi:LysR family glycine cleavage system transcriptional activator
VRWSVAARTPISLTPQGERFAAELRDGFAHIQAAVRRLQAESPPLRIRAYTTWALRWLIPRLPRLRQDNPEIDVEVTTSTAMVDLAREGVDAAIRTAPINAPPRAERDASAACGDCTLRSAGFSDALRADRATSGRLLGSKVRPGDWALWQRHSGSASTASPLLFESTTLAIQAALEGLGAVICPPAFVQTEIREGRLVALSNSIVATGDCYWLILPQGRVSPALQKFTDWLVRQAHNEGVS